MKRKYRVNAGLESWTVARWILRYHPFAARLIVSAGGYYRWFYLNRAIDELVKACDSKAFSDKQWAWLLLTPRKRDADFLRMQVVLDRKKLWVRRIWIEELTGNTVSLDLDQPVVAVQPLTLAAISKGLPKDWKRVDVPLSIEGK